MESGVGIVVVVVGVVRLPLPGARDDEREGRNRAETDGRRTFGRSTETSADTVIISNTFCSFNNRLPKARRPFALYVWVVRDLGRNTLITLRLSFRSRWLRRTVGRFTVYGRGRYLHVTTDAVKSLQNRKRGRQPAPVSGGRRTVRGGSRFSILLDSSTLFHDFAFYLCETFNTI